MVQSTSVSAAPLLAIIAYAVLLGWQRVLLGELLACVEFTISLFIGKITPIHCHQKGATMPTHDDVINPATLTHLDASQFQSSGSHPAYEQWFLQQVEQAVSEADAPDAVWVDHRVVKEDMARQRAALLSRIAGEAT